ncbi:hypothetical protein [Salipiger sp. HF18]|uniref:hypothetical protein n=1 Tax=Salipiger sp. HF18 TaxID=2721557 RepID=UPI00142DEBDE|nr:hypothetical protein [Salipiger sp. HF18]
MRILIALSFGLLLGGCAANHPGLETGWAIQEQRAALPIGARDRSHVPLAPGDRFYVTFRTQDEPSTIRLQHHTFEAGPLGLTVQIGEVGTNALNKPPPIKETVHFRLGTPVGNVIDTLHRKGLLVAQRQFYNTDNNNISDIQVRLAPRTINVFRDGQSQELTWSPAMTLADVLRSTGGPRSIGETDPYYLAVVEPRKYDAQGRLVSEPAGSFFVSSYSGTYAGDERKVGQDDWSLRRRDVYVYPNDRIRIERNLQADFGIRSPTVQ